MTATVLFPYTDISPVVFPILILCKRAPAQGKTLTYTYTNSILGHLTLITPRVPTLLLARLPNFVFAPRQHY